MSKKGSDVRICHPNSENIGAYATEMVQDLKLEA